MTELAEFLLARIAEDEAAARSARWHQVDYNRAENQAHGLRWDPARVLAECEAKRRIVELHLEPAHECIDRSHGVPIYPVSDSMTLRGVLVPGCATLRLLALPYADHPTYREEWRP